MLPSTCKTETFKVDHLAIQSPAEIEQILEAITKKAVFLTN